MIPPILRKANTVLLMKLMVVLGSVIITRKMKVRVLKVR